MATELNVSPRTTLGKAVRTLRRSGVTPANVYGHRLESTSVQAGTDELAHLLRASARNALINLKVQGESKPRTVVIRDVQRDPLTGRILHVDFYQVSMTEKMRAEVPVVLVGTSDAVITFGGVLMQTVDSVAVESLPGDMPPHFEVDVSRITQLEQSLHVRDLDIDTRKVTVLSDLDVVVARVAAPRLVAAEEEGVPAVEEGAAPPAEGAPPAAAEKPEEGGGPG